MMWSEIVGRGTTVLPKEWQATVMAASHPSSRLTPALTWLVGRAAEGRHAVTRCRVCALGATESESLFVVEDDSWRTMKR